MELVADKNLDVSRLVKCKFGRNGLAIQECTSYNDWETIGITLAQIKDAHQFWIGDWLLFGEGKYGEKYTQALEATGLGYQTLRDCKWVAKQVELSRRRDNLSWSHHEEVAGLEPKDQERWLKEAEKGNMSAKQLREAIKASKTLENITEQDGVDLCGKCNKEVMITLDINGASIVLDKSSIVYAVKGVRGSYISERLESAYPLHDALCRPKTCTEKPVQKKPIQKKEYAIETPIQKIICAYKLMKGFKRDDRAWDKIHFPRATKSAKALLETLGTWEEVAECIEDLGNKFTAKNLDWTLETIVKHCMDWMRLRAEQVK